MPIWIWYPLLTSLVTALLANVGSISLELSLTLVNVIATGLGGFGVYLLIKRLTRDELLSVIGGLLYLGTPAVWSWFLACGLANRMIATTCLIFAIWAWVRYWQELWSGQKRRVSFFLLVVLWSLSFYAHPLLGLVGIACLGVLTLVGSPKLAEGIKEMVKIGVVTFLLSAALLIPMVFFPQPGFRSSEVHISLEKIKGDLLSWKYLFWIEAGEASSVFGKGRGPSNIETLTPFNLSLPILLFILLTILKRKALSLKDVDSRMIAAFGSVSLLVVIYAMVYLPIPPVKQAYGGFLLPSWIIYLIPIFSGPALALVWKKLWASRRLLFKILSYSSLVLLLVGFIWTIKLSYPDLAGAAPDHSKIIEANTGTDDELLGKVIPKHQFNFRMDTHDASLAGQFNNTFICVPETGNYYAHAIGNPDYHVYQLLAAWRWSDNYQETNYLFDWWGVKQIVTNKRNPPEDTRVNPYDKFITKPEFYEYLGEDKYQVFTLKEASPILLATNAMPILFISKPEGIGYSLFFKSLAYSNTNSRAVVPIHGSATIEDYSLRELTKFPLIVLYDFRVRNKPRFEKLLGDYLNQGGGVIVEANNSLDPNIFSSLMPVSNVRFTDFGTAWDLEVTDEMEPEVGKVDLEGFGPAIFDKGPRGIAVGEPQTGAKVLMTNGGEVVLASRKVGDGLLVWSGLNLPYHAVIYENELESKLWSRILYYAAGRKFEVEPLLPQRNRELTYATGGFTVEFISPDKRKVELKESIRGVLFKEIHFSNWHAFLERDSGRSELRIYKAGPEFMYIPLSDAKAGYRVVLEYKKSLVENLGLAVSLLTLLTLVVYLLEGKLFGPFLYKIPNYIRAKVRSIGGGVTDWWTREE